MVGKVSLEREGRNKMKTKNRRAFLCCDESKRAVYQEKWEQRMGDHITLVNHIEDASVVYIIDESGIEQKEKDNVIKISDNLGLTVHYLNQDLINETAVENMLDGKYRPIRKEKSKSEDMEK